MAPDLQSRAGSKHIKRMLPIKSKYKIAKRLGSAIFEKTQTQKFVLSESRFKKNRRFSRNPSDYGRQLLEKQRVRYTYGLSETQLQNYVKKASATADPSTTLHRMLEMRADSIVYRAALAPTRRAARQMVSHGHVAINKKRIRTPSHALKKGDTLTIREGSRRKSLFSSLADTEKEDARIVPAWLASSTATLTVDVKAEPLYTPSETLLEYPAVFEFYSR